MKLPTFKYHPNPMKTGHVVSSSAVCKVCRRERGFVYQGPIYGLGNSEVPICPWCIADGTAHNHLGFEFTDHIGVGGGGIWETVSSEIVEEVVRRTPGFAGWQQEQWFTHCQDAAAFLGRVGWKELEAFGAKAISGFAEASGLTDEVDRLFLTYLHKDGSPTGYLFQCLHCGTYGGYTDAD